MAVLLLACGQCKPSDGFALFSETTRSIFRSCSDVCGSWVLSSTTIGSPEDSSTSGSVSEQCQQHVDCGSSQTESLHPRHTTGMFSIHTAMCVIIFFLHLQQYTLLEDNPTAGPIGEQANHVQSTTSHKNAHKDLSDQEHHFLMLQNHVQALHCDFSNNPLGGRQPELWISL